MKHLLLLRHAKARPADPGMVDRERPLAGRGHRDAALMGKAMAGEPLPDTILCSPARRTRETMAELIRQFATEPKIVLVEALYEPAGATYLETIAALGGDAERLLVVGHNPAVQATALALVDASDTKLAVKFPTCALAIIASSGRGWSAIKPGKGRLVSFRRPRDLGALDAND